MESKVKKLLYVLVSMLLIMSCKQDKVVDEVMDDQAFMKSDHMGEWLDLNGGAWYYSTGDIKYDICEEAVEYPFIDVALITVSNDEENIFIKVNVKENWFIKGLALNIWNQGDPGINDDFLSYPYIKWFDNDNLQQYLIFKIPKDGLWVECLALKMKLSIKKVVDGEVVQDLIWWVTTDGELSDKHPVEFCWKECPCYPFRTQTPGGWGAPARGNNPGAYRDAYFPDVFPDGLVVGGNYTLTLSSSMAVEDFLPSGGQPVALGQDYVDPAGALNNAFAGHVVALTLSVAFDAADEDFSQSSADLGNLLFKDGNGFDGLTVQDVLDEANIVLGGGVSSYTLGELHTVISMINEYYIDGEWTGDGTLFNDCWEYND